MYIIYIVHPFHDPESRTIMLRDFHGTSSEEENDPRLADSFFPLNRDWWIEWYNINVNLVSNFHTSVLHLQKINSKSSRCHPHLAGIKPDAVRALRNTQQRYLCLLCLLLKVLHRVNLCKLSISNAPLRFWWGSTGIWGAQPPNANPNPPGKKKALLLRDYKPHHCPFIGALLRALLQVGGCPYSPGN